jgi:hypothetical protein
VTHLGPRHLVVLLLTLLRASIRRSCGRCCMRQAHAVRLCWGCRVGQQLCFCWASIVLENHDVLDVCRRICAPRPTHTEGSAAAVKSELRW